MGEGRSGCSPAQPGFVKSPRRLRVMQSTPPGTAMRETRPRSHRAMPRAADKELFVHGFVGMDSSSFLFAQLPLLLCFAFAVTGALIAAIYLHRHKAAAA